MIKLLRKTRLPVAVVAVLAFAGTPLVMACQPAPPPISCFDASYWWYLSRKPTNWRVAKVHFGATICRTWPDTMVSSHPYLTADVYGMGTIEGVNLSGQSAWTVSFTSATGHWTGRLSVKQCIVTKLFICSLTDTLTFDEWVTTPPHIGPSGWAAHGSNGETVIWSTP